MKVVREIIWYLNGRGVLGPHELRHLRTRGYIDHAEEMELAGDTTVPDPGEIQADIEDALGTRLKPRRKARRTPPVVQPLAEAISARVLSSWPQWEESLSRLQPLASRLERVHTLTDALTVIRRAPGREIDALVAATLRGGSPSLPELWPALAFEGYRDGLVLRDERGAAAVAYRAILCGAGASELGSYAACLKQPGFAQLLALVRTQRSLLASIGRVLSNDPASFDRALFARHYDPACYWALTFVVSGALLESVELPLATHFPARPFPFQTVPECTAAWTCASAIASRHATRLFVELSAPFPASGEPLRCPRAWDRGYFAPPVLLEA